ncbi:MAG TPA: photosystem II protein PsbQ [Coleofasciculaceae cyanobacterium]
MRTYRSILALILAMVTTLLVSCGSPKAVTPPSYTSAQIEQIQQLASTVTALRDRMPILEDKIQNRNWTDVGTYIHGPLGELRRSVNYLIRELLPQEQKAASEAAKDLFSRLQSIDIASTKGNYQVAVQNYQAALKDFDQILQRVPKPKD